VKRFFNEKEVTSTLVMDALYSGCRAMEEHTRQWLEYSTRMGPAEPDSAVEQPSVLIHAERGLFSLGDDVFDVSVFSPCVYQCRLSCTWLHAGRASRGCYFALLLRGGQCKQRCVPALHQVTGQLGWAWQFIAL
jgi:hypothetical protein